jgi:ribonuclease-3
LLKIIRSLKLKVSDNKRYKKELQKLLGFKPGSITVYRQAFTHRSASNPSKRSKVEHNERLEFLGDSILDAIISDYLFTRYPNENEGFLTNMRSKIVNGRKLSELAISLSLPQFLEFNIQSFSNRANLYEDSFEALIGAIYIDKGYGYAEKFVKSKIIAKLVDIKELETTDLNYKSQLIEWAQKYKVQISFKTEKHDQDDKLFVARIKVDKKNFGSGLGASKKQAEQKAAKEALNKIEHEWQDKFEVAKN